MVRVVLFEFLKTNYTLSYPGYVWSGSRKPPSWPIGSFEQHFNILVTVEWIDWLSIKTVTKYCLWFQLITVFYSSHLLVLFYSHSINLVLIWMTNKEYSFLPSLFSRIISKNSIAHLVKGIISVVSIFLSWHCIIHTPCHQLIPRFEYNLWFVPETTKWWQKFLNIFSVLNFWSSSGRLLV